MRHLKILEYALSSLLRRRGKNLAILLSFVVVVTVLASILFVTHALKAEATRLLVSAPDLVVQRLVAGRHDLIPESYGLTVQGITGVSAVTPRVWGYYYDGLTRANYTLIGVRSAPTLRLLWGRMPAAEGECAVGSGVAEARQIDLPGELVLTDSRGVGVLFDVVGVFDADSSLLTNDLVVLGEADLRQFFSFPEGHATDLTVAVGNEREVQTVAQKVRTLLPDTRPVTRDELARTYDAVFHWRSGMMLAAFAGAALAFSILAWDKATGLSAEEQQEIGVLKAIGWDTSDVLELKTWEGLALSLVSFLLGLILAYVHVFFLGAPLLTPVLKGWSVLFPEFRLVPYLDLYQLIVLGFFTVVPYLASTVIPCWKASIADPEAVIRG
ncbi:MAG: FtsX-like permease family protein [Deltaproteobacteria bacterium]|nr:FtsX-like permease family protein [Deltaproteobacteria bacterium]